MAAVIVGVTFMAYLLGQFYARRAAFIAGGRTDRPDFRPYLADDMHLFPHAYSKACLVGGITFLGYILADTSLPIVVGTHLHIGAQWSATSATLVAAAVWIGCFAIDVFVSFMAESSAKRAHIEFASIAWRPGVQQVGWRLVAKCAIGVQILSPLLESLLLIR
jgi:hypothetical protein